MQDRSPPAHQSSLAQHGRTIHMGQERYFGRPDPMSVLPPANDCESDVPGGRYVLESEVRLLDFGRYKRQNS